jgi:hypothetical protein
MKKRNTTLFGVMVCLLIGALLLTGCKDEPAGPPALSSEIDSALYGTWEDSMGLYRITFSSSGISWGGTTGTSLNDTTSAYTGTGYSLVWIATGGNISYKYQYNGGEIYTIPVYQYELSGSQLLLKASGITFATLANTTPGGNGEGGGNEITGANGEDGGNETTGGNGEGGGNEITGAPGLSSEIDSALYGTWEDSMGLYRITFSSSGITWGGTVGTSLNDTTSAYAGTGYSLAWIAIGGKICYKYQYGGEIYTILVYQYELSGSQLLLKASGITFATLTKS